MTTKPRREEVAWSEWIRGEESPTTIYPQDGFNAGWHARDVEIERLRLVLRRLMDAIDSEQDELSPALFAAYSAGSNALGRSIDG
jgi:hypothetical protein